MALLSNTVASPSTMAGTLPLGLMARIGRVELLALAGIDGMRLVGQAGLLEEQRDLGGIGRAVEIELEHVAPLALRVGRADHSRGLRHQTALVTLRCGHGRNRCYAWADCLIFPARRACLRLSVLDQSVAVVDRPHGQSIRDTIALAQYAETLGYERFWVSEHHNHGTIAGTAPEILIAAIAATTQRIRIGSAGVMLPHYSPLQGGRAVPGAGGDRARAASTWGSGARRAPTGAPRSPEPDGERAPCRSFPTTCAT